jgi:ribosomal protein RSM22 (predicted rRNA methylase)
VDELQRAAAQLSSRYRAEVRDGRLHLADELAVRAYLATRLPATFAAVRASFAMIASAAPLFEPRSLLDIGAGPGTALWAASDCWPSVADATMLEASDAVRKSGEILAKELPEVAAHWLSGDAALDLAGQQPADLVTIAYVLDELPPQAIPPLAMQLWKLTGDMLVIVEPGTPAGWRRILAARTILIEQGADIVAPCPHHAPCPLVEPDWCHFSRRVARSRLHRQAKGAEVPWEDEKYIFIAASRRFSGAREARVLSPPRASKGKMELKLCRPDGTVASSLVTKRDGERFRTARRADWGDGIPLE